MTFNLKDLNQLNIDLNKKFKILLANENKGKIADTSETRNHLLQFLDSTRDFLNSSAKTHVPAKFKPTVFYGALYLIISYLNNTRWLASTMADTLMGIITPETTSEKPDLNDMANFYRALNVYLTVAFNELDSRKGLNKDQPLVRVIPSDQLASLMSLAYELEQNSQKALMASIDSKPKVDNVAQPNNFTVKKPVAPSAVSIFQSWDKLHTTLDDLILQELGVKSTGTMEKFAAKHPTRALQLEFLMHIRESLLTAHFNFREIALANCKARGVANPTSKEIDQEERILIDQEKRAILAGSMYLVCEQIGRSSFIHDEFYKVLECETTDPEDKEALISAASKYIRFMTIHNMEGDRAFRKDTIFSTIKGFQLMPVLQLFQDMICAQRNTALKERIEEFKHGNKVDQPKSSWTLPSISLNSLFGASVAVETQNLQQVKDKEAQLLIKDTTTVQSNI